MSTLKKDIQDAINRASAENGSDTPDFILAEYLTDCLSAYDRALVAREKWYGRSMGFPSHLPEASEVQKGIRKKLKDEKGNGPVTDAYADAMLAFLAGDQEAALGRLKGVLSDV